MKVNLNINIVGKRFVSYAFAYFHSSHICPVNYSAACSFCGLQNIFLKVAYFEFSDKSFLLFQVLPTVLLVPLLLSNFSGLLYPEAWSATKTSS
jgi:hypothetical protein